MNPQRTAYGYFALHVKFSLFRLAGLSTSYRGLGRPKNCRERSFRQMHCGVDQQGSDLHAFRHLPPLENFETFSAEREREREREGGRERERETDTQTDRQTDKHTDKVTTPFLSNKLMGSAPPKAGHMDRHNHHCEH